MDAKTRGLVALAAVSLFLAGFAWLEDRAVFGSVFFALGAVAVLGETVALNMDQLILKCALTPPTGLGLLT